MAYADRLVHLVHGSGTQLLHALGLRYQSERPGRIRRLIRLFRPRVCCRSSHLRSNRGLTLYHCFCSFTAVWNQLITIISKDDPLLPPVIFSAFAFARGIGSILSGPISTALLKEGTLSHAKLGYGVENYVSTVTALTFFLIQSDRQSSILRVAYFSGLVR